MVLASKRAQTFHPAVCTELGIDLTTKQAVAIKSASHFYPGFAPIAADIIYVNPTLIPYQKLRRPMAPMDASHPVWMS